MKSTSHVRKPYVGQTRSLVIALDVGTTFSGVSYAVLEPGEIPKIHGVTRFPGQEHVAGNSKIPSIMYYDRNGNMMAAGAEAENSSVVAQAEDDEWLKVELFKLRLRPRTMKLDMNGMHLGPLPVGKTAVHVFGDFIRYLYRCTNTFVVDTHGNGSSLWAAVEHNIQFVLSHPNGWEGAQQTKMRRAMIYAGIIPETNEGKARIRFVTEGEASLHACVLNGLSGDILASPGSKTGFLVADAGGGTLDISSYRILAQNPLIIEEIAPPDCVFAGSVFVSRRAKVFLANKLKNSKYGSPEGVEHITKKFDETTKRLFRDTKDTQYIPFGSPLDKDPAAGIRNGHLKLTGDEVAELFEPSIQAAVSSIKAQIRSSAGIIKSVFLVGGYAASAYLFAQLQSRLAKYKITVSRPDAQTSKAVADGAIGFYCDHHVSARMSKFMYGVEYLREFNPQNPDHVKRKDRLCELPSGPKLLLDAFDCILSRGVKVEESTVFSRKYSTEVTSLSTLSVFEVEIWCYRGGNTIPDWIMRDREDFSTLCLVRADLSPLSGSAVAQHGKNGKVYWKIIFSVEIHFGLTEFRARIKWIDKGQTKYGPASIVYNERGHRVEDDEPDLNPEDDNTTTLAGLEHQSREASRARTSRSHAPTQPPSHPPTQPSSKRTSMWGQPNKADGASTASIVEPPPQAPFPQAGDMSRSISTHSSAAVDPRGRRRDKARERDSVPAEPPRSHKDSHGSARLAEQLSSVWGNVNNSVLPSKEPTPTETAQGLFTWNPPVAGAHADVPAYVASQPPPMDSVVDTVDVAPPPPMENTFEVEPTAKSRRASKASKRASKIPSPHRTPVQQLNDLPEAEEPAAEPTPDHVAAAPVVETTEPDPVESQSGFATPSNNKKDRKKKKGQQQSAAEPEPEPQPNPEPQAPEPEPEQHNVEAEVPGGWDSAANPDADVDAMQDTGAGWGNTNTAGSKRKSKKKGAADNLDEFGGPLGGPASNETTDIPGGWAASAPHTANASSGWATPTPAGKKGKKGKNTANTIPPTPAPEPEQPTAEPEPAQESELTQDQGQEQEQDPGQGQDQDPAPAPTEDHIDTNANAGNEEPEKDYWETTQASKRDKKGKKGKGKGASAEPSATQTPNPPATPSEPNGPAPAWDSTPADLLGSGPAEVTEGQQEEEQAAATSQETWGWGGTASKRGSKAPTAQASPQTGDKQLETTDSTSGWGNGGNGGNGGSGWGSWGTGAAGAAKNLTSTLGGWGSGGGFGSFGGTPPAETNGQDTVAIDGAGADETGDAGTTTANVETAAPTADSQVDSTPEPAADPPPDTTDATATAEGGASGEAGAEGAGGDNKAETKKDEDEDWGLPVKKGKGGAKKKKGKK